MLDSPVTSPKFASTFSSEEDYAAMMILGDENLKYDVVGKQGFHQGGIT